MLRLLPFFLATLVSNASAAPVDEIESLLHYVGALQNASFIRNGDAHTPAAAEAHLRLKWSKQKNQIKTAEDFIRLCGTKSSMSDAPYLIRFADGREVPAATVLSNQLAALRGQSPRARPRPAKRHNLRSSGNFTGGNGENGEGICDSLFPPFPPVQIRIQVSGA